jgi:pimeloyl-ACP methyl ester carboxylesterase
MLHGSAASSAVFQKQFASKLAEQHPLIAIDLPGHGASSQAVDPAVTYSIGGFAATVSAVLDRLGIDRAMIFGWSLGGHIAIEMLAVEPARVAGLMLTGAPPVPRGPLGLLRGFHAHWDMLLASKENFSPRDVERFERLCFGDAGTAELQELIRRADGRVRSNFFRSVLKGDGADQRRTVEQAQVPVAFVNGANEPIARLGYLASLNMPELWEGQSHVIPGAGHSPFWQAPDAFNALLSRFADDVAKGDEARRLGLDRIPLARSA